MTFEEKAAKKIINILSDFTLDADTLGSYLARVAPKEVVTRMKQVANSAYQECDRIEQDKQLREEYKNGNTLF